MDLIDVTTERHARWLLRNQEPDPSEDKRIQEAQVRMRRGDPNYASVQSLGLYTQVLHLVYNLEQGVFNDQTGKGTEIRTCREALQVLQSLRQHDTTPLMSRLNRVSALIQTEQEYFNLMEDAVTLGEFDPSVFSQLHELEATLLTYARTSEFMMGQFTGYRREQHDWRPVLEGLMESFVDEICNRLETAMEDNDDEAVDDIYQELEGAILEVTYPEARREFIQACVTGGISVTPTHQGGYLLVYTPPQDDE